MAEACSRTVTINNRLGLHARPAMMFAQCAQKFDAAITVRRCDHDDAFDGKSIMHLMMLAATQGTDIEICATGGDAENALSELSQLVDSNFAED
ncbi:MAG: HPr family phosphocarrier protein [Planctomycetota bacterium]